MTQGNGHTLLGPNLSDEDNMTALLVVESQAGGVSALYRHMDECFDAPIYSMRDSDRLFT